MPDVHVPHIEEHEEHDPVAVAPAAVIRRSRGPMVLKLGLEVALIAVGVFLGLAGEQWREARRHHELAEVSLRRFRAEIVANRKAVAAVKDYHANLKQSIEVYLAADRKARPALGVKFNGLQPVTFEHTAWDLANATQSLIDIDPELAFALAHAYNWQQEYSDMTRGMVQALYLRPPSEDFDAFLQALAVYYNDVVFVEPTLLRQYDALLPQIDRALGESPAARR